jgi:hypothetical protein
MPHTCPSCKSEDVRALSVVYQSGISSHSFVGIAVGRGVSGFGGDAVSQTNLSMRAAPPNKKSEAVWLLLGLVLIVGASACLVWHANWKSQSRNHSFARHDGRGDHPISSLAAHVREYGQQREVQPERLAGTPPALDPIVDVYEMRGGISTGESAMKPMLRSGQQSHLIELTSKRFKRQMVIGGSTTLLGVAAYIIASVLKSRFFGFIAIALFAAGLIWYSIARFRAWWHHG